MYETSFSWAKTSLFLLFFFFFFYLQHVDGSFSVKPLKQKQIVGSYFNIILFNYYSADYEVSKLWNTYCLDYSMLVIQQDV